MIAVAAVIVLIHPLDPITTTVQGRYYPAGVCSCVTTGKCWAVGESDVARGVRDADSRSGAR
jgi:hypothetical protein